MTKLKILITGGTGFLGSHLVNSLVEKEYEIIVFARESSKKDRIATHLKDISYYTSITKLFSEQKMDIVIHCATCYGRNGELDTEIVPTNLLLPLEILNRAIINDTCIFINIDSFLPREINSYALSKAQFAEWLRRYKSKIKVFNLKIENIYGEGDDDSKLIPRIIKQLITCNPRIRLTKGMQVRDFVYVGDVVRLIQHIVSKAKRFNKGFYQYDVGSGKTIKIKKMVLLIRKLSRNKISVLDFGALPYRKNELMYAKPNISRAVKDFGWKPKINLVVGLKKTISWYKDNVKDNNT